MKKLAFYGFLLLLLGCVSTKSTIMNIDDNAPVPQIKDNIFVLSDFSSDEKYGYDPDYPINVYYKSARDENINAQRFLKALSGPNGEKIFFQKVDSCCPFPSKKTDMGAGLLDIYEISWVGQAKPVRLYINVYERGALLVPVGFGLKKTNAK